MKDSMERVFTLRLGSVGRMGTNMAIRKEMRYNMTPLGL